MGQVPAVITDLADIREFHCLLPDHAPVAAVATRLAKVARLPTRTCERSPLRYGLVRRGGSALSLRSTLADSGDSEPLAARLVPLITIGGQDLFDFPEFLPDDIINGPCEVTITEERALLHDGGLDLKSDVRMDAIVHRRMEELAGENRLIERAGLLLGEVLIEGKTRVIHVTAAVPATDAHGTRTGVEFALAAWESVLRERDTAWRDLRTLGWFHTHTGWGVFLSDSDLLLHRHFFPHPNMVAFVLDPTTGRDGFFRWDSGTIAPCRTYALVGTRDQVAAYKRSTRSSRSRGRIAVAATALAVIGVCVGVAYPRLVAREAGPVRVKHVVHKSPVRVRSPETVRVYHLGKRDNLWIICNRVYGDGDLVDALAKYNGIKDYSGLQVGQEIKLPSREALIRFVETRPLPVR